jgi:hypothetical protein
MAGGVYAVGASGGSANAITVSHTHTASVGDQSVNHVHTFTTDSAGTHNHTVSGTISSGTDRYQTTEENGSFYGTATTASAGAHVHTGTTAGQSANHNHGVTINSAGSSGTNANLPPYYALAYIMKS